MQIQIANFSNIKYFKPNMIPISTCNSDPAFYHNNSYNKNIYFIDKNNILNGIREESFLLPIGIFESLEEHCEKNCSYRYKVPHCQFLNKYSEHLNSLDINYLLAEFSRIAEDVRRITHFQGEPIIVLLVWEAVSNPCSERIPIQKFFASHGITVSNFIKDQLN